MTFSIQFRDNVLALLGQFWNTPAQEVVTTALSSARQAANPQEVLTIFRQAVQYLKAIQPGNQQIPMTLDALIGDEERRINEVWKQYSEQMWTIPFYVGKCEYHTPQEMKARQERAELAGNLSALLSHPNAQQYYRAVFGEDLPITLDTLKKRAGAEALGDFETVQQIDAEITQAYTKLNRVKTEWMALPEWVKELFGFLPEQTILTNPESFTSALTAIWSYNLTCIYRRLLSREVDRSSKENLVNTALAVAKILREQYQKIDRLLLDSAGLTRFPLEITNLENLSVLALAGNSLSELPHQIGRLQKLQNLNLEQNKISSLPSEIWNLSSLEFLNLHDNCLTGIPPSVKGLTRMTLLTLSHNQIASLPSEIQFLQSMSALHVDHNNLSSLPVEIYKCKELSWVYISDNQISSLSGPVPKRIHIDDLELKTQRPPETPWCPCQET